MCFPEQKVREEECRFSCYLRTSTLIVILCVLFPETGAFTVLVTLGKKEVEQVRNDLKTFNPETQKLFNNARQFHDGKWIYRRVLDKDDLGDVIELIKIKKVPKQKEGIEVG